MNITADSRDGTGRRIGPNIGLQIGVTNVNPFVDHANNNATTAGVSIPGLRRSDLIQSV